MIVLTSFGEDERLFAALRAGASRLPAQGRRARRARARDPHRARRPGAALARGRGARGRGARERRRAARPADELTPRELEVLCLIARGRSNKRIALELGVAEKTVKTHVSHVLAKLGLSDRTQAALYAVREGLVEPEGPRPNSRWWRGGSAPSLLGMPTAIVTGASRGLGLALSRALAERGWRLVIDAREAGPLEAAAAQLPGATPIPGDVADPSHRRALVEAAGGEHRPARQQRLAARAEPAARARRLPARRARAGLPRQRARAAGADPARAAAAAIASSTSPPTPPSSPTRAGAATAPRRPRSSSSPRSSPPSSPERRDLRRSTPAT